MNSTDTRFIVKAVAAVLIVWALFLHGCFLVSAGALWRDEANSVNQASLESWRAMWESLRYDSFPALYPAILRILLYGHQPFSEKRVRIVGVVVGVAFLVSLWSATRVMGSPFPVVALALLAVDPVFFSGGYSVLPYGIGPLCLLWSYCAYGPLLVTPGRSWIAIASVASILAVQCSYTNAMFIGVLGSSAALVRYLQRTPRMLWKVLLPSFLAALSLMPYVGALRQSRDWISILHTRGAWRTHLSLW